MLGSIPYQKLFFFIFYLLEDEQELNLGMLIRLRRIYTFWQLFILFLGLTYWSSAQCQFLSVACFCFAETQYQTESKRDKTNGELFWNICDFWEVKSTRDGARGGQEIGGCPREAGAPWNLLPPPIRRLTLFFCRKKSNFIRKIWAKDSPQSELRISRYKRNGEGEESQNAETER